MHDSQNRVSSAETAASESAASSQMSAIKGDKKVWLITASEGGAGKKLSSLAWENTLGGDAVRHPSDAATNKE